MSDFIHIADLHLGYAQYGLDERANDFMNNFNAVMQEPCDFFIVAGDVFHQRQVGPKTLSEIMETLRIPAKEKKPVFVIPGNHDKIFNDGMTWLGYLEHFKLIKLINNGFLDHENFRIFGFTTWNSYLKYGQLPIVEGKKNIMMLHEAMEGFLPGNGSSITLDDVKSLKKQGIDYLALGHIHSPYEIDGWIYNPGSIERTSANDAVGGFYRVLDDITNIQYVNFNVRPVHKLNVNVTSKSDDDIRRDISMGLNKVSADSIVTIKFEGRIDRIFNARDFSPKGFFHIIISNETTFKSSPINTDFYEGNVEMNVIKHMTTGRNDIRNLILGMLSVPDANQDEIMKLVSESNEINEGVK